MGAPERRSGKVEDTDEKFTQRGFLRVSEASEPTSPRRFPFSDTNLVSDNQLKTLDSREPVGDTISGHRSCDNLLAVSSTFPPYVFVSERRAPMTAATFRKLVARAGEAARLGMPIHPHMLRHSTGFKLANDGQDTRAIQHYLGHRNIQHTALYTQLAAGRFNDFWND